MLADDRDVEGTAILDQHLAGAIVDDAARSPQRKRALVVVVGHLLEPGVLGHLEEPEDPGQQAEDNEHRRPQPPEPHRQSPSIFSDRHGSCPLSYYRRIGRRSRRLAMKPGNHSRIWNPTTPTTAFPTA